MPSVILVNITNASKVTFKNSDEVLEL